MVGRSVWENTMQGSEAGAAAGAGTIIGMSPPVAVAAAAVAATAHVTAPASSFHSPDASGSVPAPANNLPIAVPRHPSPGVGSPTELPRPPPPPPNGGIAREQGQPPSEATRREAHVSPQAQGMGGGGSGGAPGGLHLLHPPPLFFLQVPSAGARRADTPWAGGPVRRRRGPVFVDSGAAGEVEAKEGGLSGAGGEEPPRPRNMGGEMAEALVSAGVATTTTAVAAGVGVDVGRGDVMGASVDTREGPRGGRSAVATAAGVTAEEAETDGEMKGITSEEAGPGGTGGGDGVRGTGASKEAVSSTKENEHGSGMFVPHLVLVSLHAEGVNGRPAKVVRAAAMDSISAKQVRVRRSRRKMGGRKYGVPTHSAHPSETGCSEG